MLTLGNKQLTVQVLDPRIDSDRLGSRYCGGGYIFQIVDTEVGPLLSGPTYPESFNSYDGQGIPDSFNLAPILKGDEALVLGVGVCDSTAKHVIEPCEWNITEGDQSLVFKTRHDFHGTATVIERTVTLSGRTVRSATRLWNEGTKRFAMRWFPHPFFPQADGSEHELIKINLDVNVAHNDGYEMAPSGFIRRRGWPWQRDHYLPLDINQGQNLVVLQRHPVVGLVSAITDYSPTYFPIWGNTQTFSWEPMIDRAIVPNQIAEWQIDYVF